MMRLVWLLAFSSGAMVASPYCAYEVKVRNPSGIPFANVPVGMVEHGAQRATALTDSSGLAKFCDAPLQPVDFVTGTLDCGVVLVKGVKPTWPETREILVTYDKAHCGGELTFPNSCRILLRVHDEQGRPLGGAAFDFGPSERSISDAFGRIFRSVKSGENLDGVIKLEGRMPAPISERCIRGNERDVEQTVVLRKPQR